MIEITNYKIHENSGSEKYIIYMNYLERKIKKKNKKNYARRKTKQTSSEQNKSTFEYRLEARK